MQEHESIIIKFILGNMDMVDVLNEMEFDTMRHILSYEFLSQGATLKEGVRIEKGLKK